MKKIYFTTLTVFSLLLNISSYAQCSGCTLNITGLDAANHIVSSGQTMCISSTGTVTGLITVSAGGTLCNQGKINSSNVWIAGGTLKNYGTIDTYSITVSAAGTFTNYATALIDSLWITQNGSTYINNGTQTTHAFAVSNNASATNNGSITATNQGDSLGTFVNNGTITITNDFANSYNTSYTNNGHLSVGNDFACSNSSNFSNNNFMSITRDFFNSTSSNFTTKCMISVGRDWYNSANVYGPSAASCGGFNITGGSYNTGIAGSASTHLDICDAGHPALGIDGPGGTIAGTTTYCSCTNSCATFTGINELHSGLAVIKLFPNPATDKVYMEFDNNGSTDFVYEIKDMMGRVITKQHYNAVNGINSLEINTSALSQGTYILSITDSSERSSKQLFSVGR